MAPALQALDDHQYIINRQQQPQATAWTHELFRQREDVEWISRVMNCWTFAYEYLRRSQSEITLHFVDEEKMKKVLTDERYSSEVVRLKLQDIKRLYHNGPVLGGLAKIRANDLLMFYIPMYGGAVQGLVHTVIAVDPKLVLEKTAGASSYPIRRAFLRDVVSNIAETSMGSVTDETLENITVVVRRFNGLNKQLLPHARELFALSSSPGNLLRPADLPVGKRPSLSFAQTHSVVPQLGAMGATLYEGLYEIKDFPIAKSRLTGRFRLSP